MRKVKEFSWLYQGHQQSNDKKSESESFLLPNILKYLAHVKKKKLYDESTSGNEKKKTVSQCLEVYASSKDKAFYFQHRAQINPHFTQMFSLLYPELEKQLK